MTDSDTPRHQSADLLLMIRPASFRMNEETAVNNAYQTAAEDGMDAVATAQAEFDGLVGALRAHGITVCVQEDDPDADTPDALFPNNWVSSTATAAWASTQCSPSTGAGSAEKMC